MKQTEPEKNTKSNLKSAPPPGKWITLDDKKLVTVKDGLFSAVSIKIQELLPENTGLGQSLHDTVSSSATGMWIENGGQENN